MHCTNYIILLLNRIAHILFSGFYKAFFCFYQILPSAECICSYLHSAYTCSYSSTCFRFALVCRSPSAGACFVTIVYLLSHQTVLISPSYVTHSSVFETIYTFLNIRPIIKVSLDICIHLFAFHIFLPRLRVVNRAIYFSKDLRLSKVSITISRPLFLLTTSHHNNTLL